MEVIRWNGNETTEAGAFSEMTVSDNSNFNYDLSAESLYFFKVPVSRVSATKETKYNSTNVYVTVPSPGMMTIGLKDVKLDGHAQYKLFNMQGNEIIAGKLNSMVTKVNTQNIENGMYIISAMVDNAIINKKILIR